MIGKVNPGPPVFTKATYTFECWSCSLPTFHVLSISFSPSSCLYLTSHLILISRLIPPQATPSLLRPVSSEDHVVYVCFPSGIAVSPLPTPCLPPRPLLWTATTRLVGDIWWRATVVSRWTLRFLPVAGFLRKGQREGVPRAGVHEATLFNLGSFSIMLSTARLLFLRSGLRECLCVYVCGYGKCCVKNPATWCCATTSCILACSICVCLLVHF